MPEKQIFVGGSFAPPLTDELLAQYEVLAIGAPAPIGAAMEILLNCCKKWWELPESNGEGTEHNSGKGFIVPLEATIKDVLWDHIPWEDELKMFAARFEGINPDTQTELRNAAFHLLWHVMELNLDREPITTDKL